MKTLIRNLILIFVALASISIHASTFEIRLVLPTPSEDSKSLVLEHADFRETIHVAKEVLVTNEHVKGVAIEKDVNGLYSVQVRLTVKGREAFAEATRAAKGGGLAILIEGEIYSAPRVQQEIASDVFSISGRCDLEEARRIAAALNNPRSTDKRTNQER